MKFRRQGTTQWAMVVLVFASGMASTARPANQSSGGLQSAREPLKVVRAQSPRVDIEDGGRLLQGIWTVSPTVELDTYYARRLGGERTITFRTEIDSISFKVSPGQTHEFIVLLDGKHRCQTRISTRLKPCQRAKGAAHLENEKIPFRIGSDNKIHITGSINDSDPLDLLFDMGADTTVLYPSAKAKRARIRVDGTMENAGTGGATARAFGNDNRIAVGTWRWDQESVLLIEKQADRADGIIGHNLFDDKVVAIDYDAMEIAIHDRLPGAASGWTSLPIRFVGTIPAVPVRLDASNEVFDEWLVLDTGSSLSVHLNQHSAHLHPFANSIKRLGTSQMRGVGSGVVHNEVFSLPKIELGALVLEEVPTHVEQAGSMASAPGGHLGMDVLKRFNTVLDFQKDTAYFSQSGHFAAAYRHDYDSGAFWWMCLIVGAAATLVWGAQRMGRRILAKSATNLDRNAQATNLS